MFHEHFMLCALLFLGISNKLSCPLVGSGMFAEYYSIPALYLQVFMAIALWNKHDVPNKLVCARWFIKPAPSSVGARDCTTFRLNSNNNQQQPTTKPALQNETHVHCIERQVCHYKDTHMGCGSSGGIVSEFRLDDRGSIPDRGRWFFF
jgi:hypothetical protein